MNIRLSKRHRLIAALLLALLAAFIYYRYYTARGVLARYGVHFDDDAAPFESPNLNEVLFSFEDSHHRLPGPSVVGDLLSVERPYRTADGHLEFAVQSETRRSGRIRIQLLSPPEGDRAFHVVDADTSPLSVTYAPQKLQGPP